MTEKMADRDIAQITYLPNPSRPSYIPPAGAVDAHCHVFGPAAQFPFAPERKYTPGDAGRDQLFALRDFLGFDKNVIVQATCHGKDNRALVDACIASNGRARGVATVGDDVAEDELKAMHDAGVRGVRFNFVKRLVDATPQDVFFRIVDRIAPLNWHVVVYFEASELAELTPFLEKIPTIVVIDHMGRPDVAAGVDSAGFTAFRDLMARNENIWTKVSCPERLSVQGPPYDDVVPFARALVEQFPDRVLWGTDWPHPNMHGKIPDDGLLVDRIPHIAVTEDLQRRLLIDNPMRLYWAD